MRENCTSGIVPGAPGNRRPYGGAPDTLSRIGLSMNINKKFRIAHISDLHIGSHSDDAWRALTSALINAEPDLILISGDLSESNSESDMENVCTWVIGEVTTRTSKPPYGLNIGKSYQGKVIIIPGNHDYFYGDVRRLQRGKSSDTNDLQFNRVFDIEHYPNWRFIDRGESPGIFIVCVDTAKQLSVANGVVERAVLEKIRKWCDKARHGELYDEQSRLGIHNIPRETAANKFREAYKLIVLHHYLVSPNIVGQQPLMTVDNAHELLGQITSDNFDVIVSGHDHLGYIDSNSYASILEPRAMARFARMHCVRRLGIRKPKCYEVDENSRLLPRAMRVAIDIWNRFAASAEDRIKKLHRWDGSTPIKRTIRRGYAEFVKYDLKDKEVRIKLQDIAKRIENEMEDILNDRNIVNAIGYSATANSEETNGFFLFDIVDGSGRADEVVSSRWIYNAKIGQFEERTPRNLSISQPLDLFETELFDLLKDSGINVRK